MNTSKSEIREIWEWIQKHPVETKSFGAYYSRDKELSYWDILINRLEFHCLNVTKEGIDILFTEENGDLLFPDHFFSVSMDKRLLSDKWRKHAPDDLRELVDKRLNAMEEMKQNQKEQRYSEYQKLKKEFDNV